MYFLLSYCTSGVWRNIIDLRSKCIHKYIYKSIYISCWIIIKMSLLSSRTLLSYLYLPVSYSFLTPNSFDTFFSLSFDRNDKEWIKGKKQFCFCLVSYCLKFSISRVSLSHFLVLAIRSSTSTISYTHPPSACPPLSLFFFFLRLPCCVVRSFSSHRTQNLLNNI